MGQSHLGFPVGLYHLVGQLGQSRLEYPEDPVGQSHLECLVVQFHLEYLEVPGYLARLECLAHPEALYPQYRPCRLYLPWGQ